LTRLAAGDAYRGGLLYGIAEGLDRDEPADSAVMGAVKIEPVVRRTTSPTAVDRRAFSRAFGYRPW
jgi:sugar/nucleoside kinase (ribokinase family)